MCEEEQVYIHHRRKLTDLALMDFFSRNQIPSFDYEDFLNGLAKPITIALALSGGGYRAMLTGGGVMTAYDSRTPNSTKEGSLGGLLQSLSYIGGISGGSWLVMSNLINDFRPTNEFKDDPNSWALQDQLLEGVPNFDPNNIITTSSEEEPNIKNRRSSGIQYENKLHASKSILDWLDLEESDIEKVPQRTINRSSSISKRSGPILDFFKSFFYKDLDDKENALQGGFNLPRVDIWRDIFSYYKELNIEVRAKRQAGYHLSFTDYWGRILARRIFPNSARSPGATITASTNLPSFQNFQQPFPIICAVERIPTKDTSSKESHLYEFTPYEFGSWDSYLNAFAPMRYLGTSLFGGKPMIHTSNPNMSLCVSGFDNIGFITGTSSCLFSHIFVYIYQVLLGLNLEVSTALQLILKSFGLSSDFKSLDLPLYHPDYASFSPNPFYGYNISQMTEGEISKTNSIFLVDGGDDGQNIPFQPFLQQAREVDIIFAFDMSSDVFNYPNGTSLKKSAQRYHNLRSKLDLPGFVLNSRSVHHSTLSSTNEDPINRTAVPTTKNRAVFPKVPSPEKIMQFNMTTRPMFLGCNLFADYPKLAPAVQPVNQRFDSFSRTTTDYLPPLIIYTANSNYTFESNTSTFKLSYTPEEVSGMMENGYNLATYMNSTYYSTCISCALLKRQFDRIELGILKAPKQHWKVPITCQKCFDDFCWTED